ncbi:glomerulosclerosis Mpv17 [Fusarium beomiforme]|uniref:Glomerulosclerosis Mpv17 n=1 Tax=Fusarium beomiforme TaxID=44412 RepID=A0A9P5B089_9HYPO|nr:glomerulosclerosis Mpv17 [Fusarium beomiforme]
MDYPPVVMATIQSAALGGIANVLAQAITAYKAGVNLNEISIDWIPVFQFLLFNVICTPPNFYWQDSLESTFPAHPEDASKTKDSKDAPKVQPRLSVRNTLIKFFLDQTVGAAVNTLLFSTYTHAVRSAIQPAPVITSLTKAITYWTSPGTLDLGRVNWATVWEAAKLDFAPLIFAGWKLWPAVSIVNFAAVKTVEGRNLVGALAGVVWGIYMSLITAQ